MWESLKNQDDYGSRAFRCCWTRQTCSLLKTDLRGLPGAVASITWLARLVRGGLRSYPPGFGPDCAVAKVFGPCCPRRQQVPCAECLAVRSFPALEKNLKLL